MTLRLLLAEDEEALAIMLQYNLDKEGFDVALAADGTQALKMAEAIHPDILLLDWMLPGVSGIEVCRRLRLAPDTRNIPIMMLTARSEPSDRLQGLGVGADDYLSKPFAMSELIARVRRLSGLDGTALASV